MKELDTLRQLKRKYNAGMVSALVGAGFTKNLYDKAPDWKELLAGLVEEAYKDEIEMYQQCCHLSCGPDDSSDDSRKSKIINRIIDRDGYLKVVSKYIECKVYREAIDYYIETQTPYFYKIDDEKYGVKGNKGIELTPKNLAVHRQFLSGEWQYVFTTNFDNALEFVDKQSERRYIVISSDYEMSRRKMKRPIVKIHGSLVPPEESIDSPFVFDGDHSCRYIISGEDFDNYSTRHEAFSYLLRIAMLSGAYCLLGFSGDDPNFKSWLNWVKDVLDKSSPDSEYINDDGKGENLVNAGEEDIKVFLILVDNEPITVDRQLYYKNHHIGVIHLGSPEIVKELNGAGGKAKPQLMMDFLNYIVGTSAELKPNEGSRALSTAWRTIFEKINDGKPIEDTFVELKSLRYKNKYAKGTMFQNFLFDELLKKNAPLSEQEKELLFYVLEDVGIQSRKVPSKIVRQIEASASWKEKLMREASLSANKEIPDSKNDLQIQENILRAFYRLDFSRAKKLLSEWNPTGHLAIVKASLDYYFNQQESLKLLDAVIKNSDSDVERYEASLVYIGIDGGFSSVNSLSEYKDRGLLCLLDVLGSITDSIRGKGKTLNAYGTEMVTVNVDGYEPDSDDVNKSFRFLNLLSGEGFNLCYGILNVIKIEDWYNVFQRMYKVYPYACLFYSSQYNNRNVLRRIGQDFAFEETLQEELPNMLQRIVDSLISPITPNSMRSGLLQIGSQFFWGMKEEKWYSCFSKYLTEVYESEEEKYTHSRYSDDFVANALVCLHEKKNISEIFTTLLRMYGKMPDKVTSLITRNLRLCKIKRLNRTQTKLLESLATEEGVKDSTVALLNEINEIGLLPKRLKQAYIDSVLKESEFLKTVDCYVLYKVCCLSKDNPIVVAKLKEVILERDIWDCGVNGQFAWGSRFFPIMHLDAASYIWTFEEIARIYSNLKRNLSLLTEERIKQGIFGEDYKNLLQEMRCFSQHYSGYVEDDVKREIEDKLVLARHYDSLEDGLYSDNPDVVEDVTTLLNKMYRRGQFEENRHLFDVILSKCTMMKPPGITDCLVTIAVAVHFCTDAIKSDPDILKLLYRLLLQYKDKDLRDLDLDVIHVGHALLEIAKLLQRTDLEDSNVDYWLANNNLNRLNYLEY